VHRALPAHAGFGSGTQLALAVGRALAEIHNIAADAPGIARAVGRAKRSAIGTWTFASGGFVVEGGHRPETEGVPPLLARLPLPATWRCVVALPRAGSAISGADEAARFAQLPPPPERDAERVAHLVLMSLLPALVEGDLHAFGSALTAIQRLNGSWFSAVQGGTFAAGASADLVRRMTDWGAMGVGQSSWGPAVYGIVDGEAAGRRLADEARRALGPDGSVYEGAFRNEGARVWRQSAPVAMPQRAD
jgi:beta-RFAP synthase